MIFRFSLNHPIVNDFLEAVALPHLAEALWIFVAPAPQSVFFMENHSQNHSTVSCITVTSKC